MLLTSGDDAEAMLRTSEALEPKLLALREAGAIGGFDAVHRYVPSEATQKARQAALPGAERLKADLAQTALKNGLDPDLFSPFLDAVETSKNLPPITPQDDPSIFQGTPLWPKLVNLMVEHDDRWFGFIPLSAVQDLDALETVASGVDQVEFMDLKEVSASSITSFRDAALIRLIIGLVVIMILLYLVRRDAMVTARILFAMISAVIGERFADKVIEDDACDFGRVWQDVIDSGSPIRLPATCAIRTRSGKVREIAGHVSRAPTNGVTAVILAGWDVTNEKALAARLRRSENLASVGTLAAGLAHEIRNPLNGAQLHLTFLARALDKAELNGDLREAVTVVKSEISRLSGLVNEFLDFARPSKLTRAETSLRDVVERALRVVPESGVVVSADLPGSDVVAEIDADRIEQVLINLLFNAREAAAGAGGRVMLRLYREPRDAIIEVRDNGNGIAPNEPVFDAFYSTKSAGTGLGLAIAHRIVDEHGGRLSYESVPGDTVFRMALPLTDPERVPSTKPQGAIEHEQQ